MTVSQTDSILSIGTHVALQALGTDQALPARIDDIPDNAATGFYSKK
jgi:hypothetical protein